MSGKRLQGKKILFFIENKFDDTELIYPRYRLIEEGAKVVVAGPKANESYQSKNAIPFKADVSFSDVVEKDFDAVYIPGGYAPDKLRQYSEVLDLMRHFHGKEKPIGFICHAGWVPASSKILKGVKCTSTGSIKDDLMNAGALWVDEPVVVDRHFLSSRRPDDLPYFCPEFIDLINKKR